MKIRCLMDYNNFLSEHLCTYILVQVSEVKEDDVVCVIKNSATLDGTLFTLHASQVCIDMPTLSEKDKEASNPSVDLKCFYAFYSYDTLSVLIHLLIIFFMLKNTLSLDTKGVIVFC